MNLGMSRSVGGALFCVVVLSISAWGEDAERSDHSERSGNLFVDASGAYFTNGNRFVRGIEIRNLGPSNITIQAMTVSWTHPNPNRRIRQIQIETILVWNAYRTNGSYLDIDPYTLAWGAPTNDSIDFLRFNRNMGGSSFDITFEMSDLSTKTVAGITP